MTCLEAGHRFKTSVLDSRPQSQIQDRGLNLRPRSWILSSPLKKVEVFFQDRFEVLNPRPILKDRTLLFFRHCGIEEEVWQGGFKIFPTYRSPAIPTIEHWRERERERERERAHSIPFGISNVHKYLCYRPNQPRRKSEGRHLETVLDGICT